MATKRVDRVATTDLRPIELESLAGYWVRRANNRIMADVAASLAAISVRPTLFAMLNVIARNPGVNQSALGGELGIQRANLVPLVSELIERRLVDRQPDPGDRRAVALYLTREGAELLGRASDIVVEHEDRVLARLSPAERRQLIQILTKLTAE